MGKTLNVKLTLKGAAKAAAGLSKVKAKIGGAAKAVGSALPTFLSFGKLAVGGGLLALAGGAAAAAVGIVKMGVGMEQTRVAFRTMIGDVAKADAVLEGLQEFSNKTPFKNSEVIGAGKTLLSFGVAAEEVQSALRMIGDAAAGTGKPLNEMAAIFGKAFAKGKADSETLNQLSEAGVPIVKVLGKMYGKTGEEIYKMASQGKITSQVLTDAFKTMTGEGGVFQDMMARQADTVGGKWSTVVGKLELTAAKIGELLIPAFGWLMDAVLGAVDAVAEFAQSGDAITWLATLGMTGINSAVAIMKGFNNLKASLFGLTKWMGDAFSGAWNSIVAVALGALDLMVQQTINSFNWISDLLKEHLDIDIGRMKRSEQGEWLKKQADASAAAAEKANARVVGGTAISDEMGAALAKNAEWDKWGADLGAKIGEWQAKTLDERMKSKRSAEAFQGRELGTGAAAAAPTAKPGASGGGAPLAASARVSVDRLAKQGMFIGGSAAGVKTTERLAKERNTLLKDLKRAINALDKGEPRLA